MNFKKSIFLWIVALVLLAENAEGQRKKIKMDSGWRFHLGHSADAVKDFNYSIANSFAKSGKSDGTPISAKFDDKDWRLVNLPHDWAVELPFKYYNNFDVMAHGYKPIGGLFPETSVGWYRKVFNLEKADSGKRFSIQFDGVFRDSKIWVNGFYLGNNESGYIGFTYDITDYVNFGAENTVVVRADASQYEGWFYEGAGIYRHVWLNQFNNTHIVDDGIFAYSQVNNDQATITVETTFKNQNLPEDHCSVQTFITDVNGIKVGSTVETPLSILANEKKTIKQEILINTPILWSIDKPYLYKIVSHLVSNGKVLDHVKTSFGIRTLVVTADKGLFLNGNHLKVKGVNCHQDHAGVGSALPDYLHYYRIKLLKEMGVNAYRTSHNPPTPEFLDACDSLGLLVMDETRLLNSSGEYMDQFQRLILRDRNHPSVFMWSIGNEEDDIQGLSSGKRIAQSMLMKQIELDPTRTSTYAANIANIFEGINTVIPIRAFNYSIAGIEPYHLEHPNQPIIGTEMGSTVSTRGIYEIDSISGYVPDQDVTFPYWANTAEQWWPLAANNPWWIGGFIWTGFDYRGEPTPFQWPNINSHFGVMDMCGFPKNIYYYYKSWWKDEDVLHISPHWNWKGEEGKKIEVWVNSNAESVELVLNNKTLGKKVMPRNGHLTWNVPYKPGTLEAIGYWPHGKFKAYVTTTGEAYQIILTPDREIITADGMDVTIINIRVIDKNGYEVPNANNLIQLSVIGNAKIIGVGNGDPSSHEPDWFADGNYQRYLFNGKCQAILQSQNIPGLISVEAKSIGLKNGIVSIESISKE